MSADERAAELSAAPPAAPAPADPLRRVFFGPHGVRAGWRIALWVVLMFALTALLGGLAMVGGMRPDYILTITVTALAAVLSGWVMLAGVDRRRPGALGFALEPAAARDSALGLGFGAAAFAIAAIVLVVTGNARWVADSGTATEYVAALGRAGGLFLVAAAAEEAVYRGYGFQALVQGVGAWPAVLLTSAAFALAHRANPNVTPVALANIFLAGVMLGWAYLRTRSLWFCTAAHLAWNWVQSALLDFPVSGLVRDTPLYNVAEHGPAWWTGADFGPEGGAAATLALLAGTAWLLRSRWVRESPRMRALRPLVDTRLGDGDARAA